MSRYAAFVLLLSSGIVFQLSHGTEVNVTNKDGKLCLYASLTVNFSVEYTAAGKGALATFGLPSNVTTTGSKCDNTSSTLTLNFGAGHSWSINFTVNGKNYQTDTITFSYNLNDSSLFPNSESNETKSVTAKPQITDIGLGTCYSCKSRDLIQADLVNMTLSDVLIQAFVSNGSRSENETICSADVPTTTAAPTTTVTNSTSTPTTPPTTTPTPTLPTPTTGKYGVKNDANGTDCLLATFGLRIGFTQGEKYQEMNFEPNGTKASGSCGTNSSELLLVSNDITIMFTFISDSKKFRLHALNVTTHGVQFSEVNTNLSLWEASVGSSYMCNKEQNNTITNLLSLYTFNLQVQPFEVKKGVFSTAHECSLDDTSILIPIIVGAALAGLILVVVIAYVIGRRKTYVGYQTL
ncbi:lysosome-associated membrane glycoprotein 2 isoform X2 [Anabas testudineus]|uniref:lysosome-associated membrane glycoprotein 2 isoform X2 n=1 Tax=Anabas testudineus TaxID=64144 RepID=UPI000E456672|nr:lysosome-associated membrane glycoprotein 2 isoform X2 [Anabas testudineus]